MTSGCESQEFAGAGPDTSTCRMKQDKTMRGLGPKEHLINVDRSRSRLAMPARQDPSPHGRPGTPEGVRHRPGLVRIPTTTKRCVTIRASRQRWSMTRPWPVRRACAGSRTAPAGNRRGLFTRSSSRPSLPATRWRRRSSCWTSMPPTMRCTATRDMERATRRRRTCPSSQDRGSQASCVQSGNSVVAFISSMDRRAVMLKIFTCEIRIW